ncbi:MAG: UTP--glucose-1-phosphate uridylyltransferase GalU [Oscillospiraceae bacterium]|nr:UTP--glucose-1-phosphate uridylyltransferase GalU [Oscillospiraceae bacterium]
MRVKKAVIPAAGLGTRMLPATKSIPKEMLPILDRPAIEIIVNEAIESGIEDILIITNRGKGAIEDYFDFAPDLERSLEKSGKLDTLEKVRYPATCANIYFVRQKETKGLGHAVWCAKEFVGDEPFAVLLGDDIMVGETPVIKQLIDAAEKYNASAVGAQWVSDEAVTKYCSLKIDELENRIYRVSDVIEKPPIEKKYSNYAILGRYVLTPEIFDILEKTPPGAGGEIQLTDGLNSLCKVADMVAVDFDAKRYDTGNLIGFMETTLEFGLKHPEVGPWLREYIANMK